MIVKTAHASSYTVNLEHSTVGEEEENTFWLQGEFDLLKPAETQKWNSPIDNVISFLIDLSHAGKDLLMLRGSRSVVSVL